MLGGFVNGLLASFDSAHPNRAIDHMIELFLGVVGLVPE